MRYEILGSFRVVDRGQLSSISATKIEALLVTLLIRSGQVVPTSQLITEIWGHSVPRRAVAGIHVYISKLRKFLDRPEQNGSTIVTRSIGYMLLPGADELDLHSFEEKVRSGRGHLREHDHQAAAGCFQSALSLVRGPVLDGNHPGPIVSGFVSWLNETRLECTEMLIDAQLALGHHRQLIGELYSLTAEHPLREAFHRQLMLALYRSKRQANALQAYDTVRSTLREELGIEPCQSLQKLQQAILRVDDRLDVCAATW